MSMWLRQSSKIQIKFSLIIFDRAEKLYEEYDAAMDTFVLDEDKLLDWLEVQALNLIFAFEENFCMSEFR